MSKPMSKPISKRAKQWMIGLVLVVALVAGLLPVLSVRADFGVNWTAQYYNNIGLTGDPVVTQTGLPGVNFTWGSGSPANGVNSDQFSVRFTSTQTFAGGTYDFIVTSDDGVRVFIDGVNVLDRFVPRVQATDRFTQVLSAGTHSLVVEYFEDGDQAMIQFQWFLVAAPPVVAQPTNQLIVTPAFIVVTPVPGGAIVPTPYPTPSGPAASIFFVRALALRTGPYLGATYITRIDRDPQWYAVDARNDSEGVFNWYRVTTPDGRTGWASGRYLNLNVDPNTLPVAGSIFDEIDNAPDVGAAGVATSVLNLRVRPSTRALEIANIGYGERVSIIGRTVQASMDQWYQVRRADGQVGWVAVGFMRISGQINAVPIR